jgi:hypothetical protein
MTRFEIWWGRLRLPCVALGWGGEVGGGGTDSRPPGRSLSWGCDSEQEAKAARGIDVVRSKCLFVDVRR